MRLWHFFLKKVKMVPFDFLGHWGCPDDLYDLLDVLVSTKKEKGQMVKIWGTTTCIHNLIAHPLRWRQKILGSFHNCNNLFLEGRASRFRGRHLWWIQRKKVWIWRNWSRSGDLCFDWRRFGFLSEENQYLVTACAWNNMGYGQL